MLRLESDTVLDSVFATDTNPVLPLPVIFQHLTLASVCCLESRDRTSGTEPHRLRFPGGPPNPMMRRVNWSITTKIQWVVNVADSHRNRSQLHRLSYGREMSAKMGRNPSQAGSEGSGFGELCPYRSRGQKPKSSAGRFADSPSGDSA